MVLVDTKRMVGEIAPFRICGLPSNGGAQFSCPQFELSALCTLHGDVFGGDFGDCLPSFSRQAREIPKIMDFAGFRFVLDMVWLGWGELFPVVNSEPQIWL